jgi:DNA primase
MDAVEDIKSRLAIEDVIGRYVELKRAGRNFKGLSPFSSEKTPSFMVSPEKQIWHDFSSGKGGNMFSFVMEMEGLDFKGALELLARQAGVDLSQYRTGYDAERGKQKERLYEATELAAKFYQVHFSKTPEAYEYILKKRGYTKQTALDFRVGYSPSGNAELSKFLIKKGFTEQELQRAGLASKRYRDLRDMFRGRIMVPLQDPQGRVIGFTARLLRDEPNAPKYINTPQTPLYDKSRHVFGLHLAKEAIRKNDYAVVVEGNLDVIASHQAGVLQTVATAGTAMTEQHLKILGRFTHDVRLAFDQDNAGLQAAERAIPLASKADISLSIITVPGSKDPDELIQKDPKAWEKVIEKPQYALDWLIERYQVQLDINSAQGKRQFSDILLKVIKGLTDSVEQDHYVTEIAKLIGVSPDALRDKLKGTSGERKVMRKAAEQPKLDPTRIEQVKTQNQLLALLLLAPETREQATKITSDMLPEKPAQALFEFLQKHPDLNLKKDAKKLPQGSSDFIKIMLLLYEQLYQGLETLELRYEAARLQARLIDHYVKVKKGELSARMREANDAQMAALLKEAKDLDLLLRSTKEAISG